VNLVDGPYVQSSVMTALGSRILVLGAHEQGQEACLEASKYTIFGNHG
jgi:hypothetical protein